MNGVICCNTPIFEYDLSYNLKFKRTLKRVLPLYIHKRSFNLGEFALAPQASHRLGRKGWASELALSRYCGFDGARLQLTLDLGYPSVAFASLSPAQAADLAKVLAWWSENPWYGSDSLEPPVVDSWSSEEWG